MTQRSEKLRKFCHFNLKHDWLVYKRRIATVEGILERSIANGIVITDSELADLISAHIIDMSENRYQGVSGKYDWFLSIRDRKAAIANIKRHFTAKYNVPTSKSR